MAQETHCICRCISGCSGFHCRYFIHLHPGQRDSPSPRSEQRRRYSLPSSPSLPSGQKPKLPWDIHLHSPCHKMHGRFASQCRLIRAFISVRGLFACLLKALNMNGPRFEPWKHGVCVLRSADNPGLALRLALRCCGWRRRPCSHAMPSMHTLLHALRRIRIVGKSSQVRTSCIDRHPCQGSSSLPFCPGVCPPWLLRCTGLPLCLKQSSSGTATAASALTVRFMRVLCPWRVPTVTFEHSLTSGTLA